MTDAVLESVLRRDRAVVLTALFAITALAWVYVLRLAVLMHRDGAAATDMSGMDMARMDMADVVAPVLRPWSAIEFAFMFAMWAIMMVGMMLPSAAPMVLIYARVARQAVAKGKPFAATAWFAGGYLLAWTAFALLATAVQWALESALLLTPMMASASNTFGGLVLIAAGIYQWTPLKESCLSWCQSPLVFIYQHGGFRREARAALGLGAQHGLYCIGCCWALMMLLFVGGIMNVLWIAAIAILILIEKIIPTGRWLPRIVGIVLAGSGVWLLSVGM
jgi:predicted metal-binding membrane protein